MVTAALLPEFLCCLPAVFDRGQVERFGNGTVGVLRVCGRTAQR